MRVLITGATGFAGSHLVDLLLNKGQELFALVRSASRPIHPDVSAIVGDLGDADSLVAAVRQVEPDVIYHLGGQADVGLSWKKVALTLTINTVGTVNLLEAVVAWGGTPRIVVVTTGDMYGVQPPEAMPLTEQSVPQAYHPYGVSKIAISQLVALYVRRYQLDIIEARPFNHIGPRQSLGFVVPDFASQIASIKLGRQSRKMMVGNLKAQRDFTDVRDMVRAYSLLAEQGKAGEVYLICSGQPVAIHYLLNTLAELGGVELQFEYDSSRMRPSDTPLLYGSASKIRQHAGWQPEIHLRQSLQDILQEWEERLGDG